MEVNIFLIMFLKKSILSRSGLKVGRKTLNLKIPVRLRTLLPCFLIISILATDCFAFPDTTLEDSFYQFTLSSDNSTVFYENTADITHGVGTKYEFYDESRYYSTAVTIDNVQYSRWAVLNSKDEDYSAYTSHSIDISGHTSYVNNASSFKRVMFKGLLYHYNSEIFPQSGYLVFNYYTEFFAYSTYNQGYVTSLPSGASISAKISKPQSDAATTTFIFNTREQYSVAPLITECKSSNGSSVALKFTYIVPVTGGTYITGIVPRYSSETANCITVNADLCTMIVVNDRLNCYFTTNSFSSSSSGSSGSGYNYSSVLSDIYSMLESSVLMSESINSLLSSITESEGTIYNSCYSIIEYLPYINTDVHTMAEYLPQLTTYLQNIQSDNYDSSIALQSLMVSNNALNNSFQQYVPQKLANIETLLQSIDNRLSSLVISSGGSVTTPTTNTVNNITNNVNNVSSVYNGLGDNATAITHIFDGFNIPDLSGYTNPLTIWFTCWEAAANE